MESWRRAWKGRNAPVEPFENTEWVEQRKEALAELASDLATASDEVATYKYRHVQVLWLFDHVDELEAAEEISPEEATQIREARSGR